MIKSSLGRALAAFAVLACASTSAIAQDNPGPILERFAADYLDDPTFQRDWTFGIEVDGSEWWTVSLDHAAGSYSVTEGQPEEPTFYYTTDRASLGKVDRGEMAALTGMAKAFSTDVTPMDIELMEGAPFDPAILGLTFHFWTRGLPERTNYLTAETRFTHGTNAGIIYYQPGFRSGFFHIEPGHHVNENPDSRTNPFPSLVVITQGEAIARIGGSDTTLSEGDVVLIPAGISHEFFNESDDVAIGLLFMFGEGA
jgi:mannose-6-phosphate isomerase-like protein (cupin superfamily)